MSRLIDADRLFSERPEYRNPIHEKNGDFNKGWNACVDTFCDIIKEQPTVYDVDKVCEELHHCGAFEVDWEEKMAIDIVKRGGVDDKQGKNSINSI